MMTSHLASIAIDVIASMHPSNVTVKRAPSGQWIDGRWVDGAQGSPEPIDATVHAMRPKEVHDIPEGLRYTDMRVVHTRASLKIHDDNDRGDILVYNGNEYKVLMVNERPEGDFNRAVIGRNNVRTNTV